jgi:hypothetical protein
MLANTVRGEMRLQPLMSDGIVAVGNLSGFHGSEDYATDQATAMTRQMPYEPLPASVLFDVAVIASWMWKK